MAGYLLKATDREMADWKAAARAEGVPFAEWLRRAAASALAGQGSPGGAAVASVPASPDAEGSARRRAGPCVHRRGPDEFCPRCDR